MALTASHQNDSERAEENSHTSEPQRPTPLPKLQLFILLYLQVAEPITAFIIFPFINQLIYEYGITNGDKTTVGYYAGSVSSLFFLTEMVCVYHWGRLSDRIGRRPVLLTGICGLMLSSICFGLSKTFVALMLSRALVGALNGNVAVHKSIMAEITDETNQAQAFSFMPLVFGGGASIASFMGGGLAHPYERFPKVFGSSQFWKNYPYALPCFVSAAFCVSAFVLAFFFLKESLHAKSPIFGTTGNYGTPGTPGNGTSGDTTPTASTALLAKATPPTPPSLREVLTPRVRLAILNSGTFALLNVIFLYLHPLFMSTPIPLGGLGFEAPTIGIILGVNGIVNGLFQSTFFSLLHRRFGTRTLFFVAITSNFVVYLSWPLQSLFAKRSGKVDAAVITVLAVQQLANTLSGMGFGCTQIFIISAAPTRNALGATTGLGQTLVSLTRAVGPAGTASLFALSIQHNLLGGKFVYVVLILLVLLALAAASRLPKVTKRASDENEE